MLSQIMYYVNRIDELITLTGFNIYILSPLFDKCYRAGNISITVAKKKNFFAKTSFELVFGF